MVSVTLRQFNDLVDGVEGWFHPAAVAASDAILRQQMGDGVHGDLFEIGAWHGKSAAMWLVHARSGETVHVVDYDCRDELKRNLERISLSLGCKHSLTKGSSFNRPDASFLTEFRRKMRLIHIDGDHTGPGVTNDLGVAVELLSVHGVIIVDDFMSWRFPQITESVYGFLADNRRQFAMFACGDNKAFICNAKRHDFWSRFAADQMRSEINDAVDCEFFDVICEGRHIVSFRRLPPRRG